MVLGAKVEFLLVSVALVVMQALGAWLSVKLRNNQMPIWTSFLLGNVSGLVWLYVSKWSKLNLLFASLFFDIVTCVVWTIVLVCLGDKMTTNQVIGTTIAVVGLIWFNL